MSLLYPAYLAALFGLALPWLLHRFSNQQAPLQPFPSTRFLQAAPPPVSRMRQLRYRALLLLRILSLLLLCVLFAQPWLDHPETASGARRHHFLVLDQSLSMRTANRWPDALDRARAIANALPPGDTFEILGFDTGLHRTGQASESISSQWQVVSNWQPGFAAADYGTLMQGINRLAADWDTPVKLWLITDVQLSALPAQLNALYAPQLDEMIVESVAGIDERNVHVQANATSDDGVNVSVTAQLRLSATSQETVRDAATAAEAPLRVQLHADERLLAEQSVSLTESEWHTVRFEELTLPATEQPVFTVSVDTGDDLPDDDRVEVVVKSSRPIPMTLLSRQVGVSDPAAVFLSTALQTDDKASVTVISGGTERLPPDALHVISAHELSQEPDLDVRQFVDSDANVLLFSAPSATVLPDESDTAKADVHGQAVGIFDEAHPLALGRIDWSGVRFYDTPRLLLEKGDRVLLQSEDRRAILVEKRTPRGRLLLLNDRLDGIGSNLPLQPAFVELMQSILSWFNASTALPDQLIVGERLALPAQMQVLDPRQQPLLSLDASAQSGSVVLSEPGLYTVVGVRGEQRLRVVTDAREADITTLDVDTVQSWQQRHASEVETSAVHDGLDTESADALSSGRSLPSLTEAAELPVWRFLLPLLLLALVLEPVLANRRLDVRRDGT